MKEVCNVDFFESKEVAGRHSIINEHLLYAERLATKFYGRRAHTQAELEDIVGAAYLGLCDAAARFDLKKSDAFKTYSYFRILGTMYDYVQVNGGISRNTYKKIKNKNQKNAEACSVTSAQALGSFKSLIEDSGITVHYSKSTQGIEISYVEQAHQEEKVSKKQVAEVLRRALATLDPVLRLVLEKRYFEEKSLSEIGRELPEYSKTFLCRAHQKGLDQLRFILLRSPEVEVLNTL